MAANKRLTKSQLRDDKFIDTVAHYAGQLREHQRIIIGGIAVFLIVVLAISWGASFVKESNRESRVAFSSALGDLETAIADNIPEGYESALQSFEAVRNQYGGKGVGVWSLYYTGYCKEQLKNYQGASDDYEAYLDKEPNGDFSLGAKEGLATCLYNQGKVRAAAELLEELASRPGANEIRVRAWLYRAGQIYLSSQYYENAQAAFMKLEAVGAGPYEAKVRRDLEAIRVLRS